MCIKTDTVNNTKAKYKPTLLFISRSKYTVAEQMQLNIIDIILFILISYTVNFLLGCIIGEYKIMVIIVNTVQNTETHIEIFTVTLSKTIVATKIVIIDIVHF